MNKRQMEAEARKQLVDKAIAQFRQVDKDLNEITIDIKCLAIEVKQSKQILEETIGMLNDELGKNPPTAEVHGLDEVTP